MPDYYLQDRSRLRGQPKRTIADYVESQGILVPRRFSSLPEARASGLPILVRSEHPQDYDGASGMLESVTVSEFSDAYTEEFLLSGILKEHGEGTPGWKRYCTLLNVDVDAFRGEISYSLWEKLAGYNRTIIADSALPQRYHITTKKIERDKNEKLYNYTIFDQGKILNSFAGPLTAELEEDVPKLIEFYESIRHLPRFNPQHCPIMEVQTLHRQNYFLQYHRTRDFTASTFVLDRPPLAGETEALLVRGATPPEGFTCKATVCYEWWTRLLSDQGLPEHEEASFDLHYDELFSELMAPQRKLQLSMWEDLSVLGIEIVLGHYPRSKLFKPQVSVIFNGTSVLSEGETEQLFLEAERTNQDQYLTLHLISDGRKAYLRRV